MVNPSTSKSKKNEEDKNVERTRLKNLAIRRKIVAENPARGFAPLGPSKQVIKHHGKDILRKSSQRKNRFLFSFPGLLAPKGGGRIGELKNLGTQNPILYLDFPQGRMKLFGTILYPENRYLTLQFSRGGKNVMCEDYFDNMIVFSDSWWIGKRDENPDEARLDFPKELSEGQNLEYDFKGGAGEASKQGVHKTGMKELEEISTEAECEDEFSDAEKKLKEKMETTPVRHSSRTAGKKFKFSEMFSEDNPDEKVADISEGEEKKMGNPGSVVLDVDSENAAEKNGSLKKIQSPIEPVAKNKKISKSAAKSRDDSGSNHSSLVQATISTLFKKVGKKNSPSSSKKSSGSKASAQKLQPNGLKSNIDQDTVPKGKRKIIKEKSIGTRKKAKKRISEIEDDDIEEFSSSSQDTDEDWNVSDED
ncbi:hypothetical protein AB3S75_027567 [Citrus x aurantiifolia]